MKFFLNIFFVAFIICLFIPTLRAQYAAGYRIGFYNVENFFDTEIDSTREYNAFTPEGEQAWNFFRYRKKRMNIFKTLLAAGEGQPLALIGFCEIENDQVLRDLIISTPLKNFDYQYVNYPSPDRRGIDVGLIYQRSKLRLISSSPIPLKDPENENFRSRDMLYASFLVQTDTLHVYINHWPSRWGGELPTRRLRMLAAQTLRKHVDSMRLFHPQAKIVIMGDFNDTPNDESIIKGLQALSKDEISDPYQLVNLFTKPSELGFEGTLKHQYDWQIFDMIIISQALFSKSGVRFVEGSQRIFAPDFLFTEDERYMGKKLFRTYIGPRYEGGFADHLPVFIDLEYIDE
ncbi:MAG: endonuclease [Bacteroidales bacterium]|nr:endonuclease [Bacteroidales bacterium]